VSALPTGWRGWEPNQWRNVGPFYLHIWSNSAGRYAWEVLLESAQGVRIMCGPAEHPDAAHARAALRDHFRALATEVGDALATAEIVTVAPDTRSA
jgi:hypothetical protein